MMLLRRASVIMFTCLKGDARSPERYGTEKRSNDWREMRTAGIETYLELVTKTSEMQESDRNGLGVWEGHLR